jgi:ABC-type transport system substrate-binding protein
MVIRSGITRRQWTGDFARTLGLGAVASAAGCGGKRRRTPEPDSITVLYPTDETVLGPDMDMAAQFMMFLPLAVFNVRGKLEGRLAERWEHTPDFRTWTIRLRDGIRRHDGVPATAHDIKFTVDLLTHPDVMWWAPDSFTVKVIDDLTYAITCRQNGLTATIWDDWRVYYPKHILEKLDRKEFMTWDFWKRPVGNGPYCYVRHLPKTMLQLGANSGYHRGLPEIPKVVLKFGEPERGNAIAELLAGNVDAVTGVKRTDVIRMSGDGRFRAYDQLDHGMVSALYWNHRHPLFRDVRVRRALTLAINRRELAQALNYPADTPVLDAPLSRASFNAGSSARRFPTIRSWPAGCSTRQGGPGAIARASGNAKERHSNSRSFAASMT